MKKYTLPILRPAKAKNKRLPLLLLLHWELSGSCHLSFAENHPYTILQKTNHKDEKHWILIFLINVV
jgi:hypothetical protein